MSVPAGAITSNHGESANVSLRKRLVALLPVPRLSARLHIVFGLTSLVGTSVLLAIFLGVIPDRRLSEQQSRVVLAETITTLGSALLRNGETAGLRFSLEFVVAQNPDIHAIRLKRRNGGEFQFLSEQARSEEGFDHDVLTDDIRVPILQRNRPWGDVVVQFVSSRNEPWYLRYLKSPWAVMGLLSFMCFPLFYLFLGKVLKELDPSAAVPSRVRSALDTIAEALLVLDVRGNIVLANAAFMELSGKSMEQLLGQPASTLPWQEKGAYVWEDSLYNAHPSRHDKVRFTHVNGILKTFIVNCSPVITGGDEVGGVLVSMDDITQLEEQEVLLRESMQLAEEANSAKSIFLSNMSHEIRTPMTAILGFTEIMKRGKRQSESERQDYLDTIANSGQHLLELINDVLDLSKVESGAMDMESLPCNCAVIANDVVRVLQSKADEKGIALGLTLESSLPEEIVADPSRLRQVITNLLGNAIKFTEQGKVTVSLSAQLSGEHSQPWIYIDVADSGIGMSADQQARIFEAFSQADNSIARRFGGTGLGLSISRQLTEAMNGTLSVTSIEGEGSTFRVSLPFNTDDYELLCPETIQQGLRSSQQMQHVVWDINPARVLVVDDGAENRQLMSILLGDLGLDVTLACNGQEGVDSLFAVDQADEFDLVFMDIQMPVLDGYQAAQQMRSRGATIPVVALTANAMKGFEKKVLAAGFSHYMVKPIDVDRLYELLAELVGGSARTVTENMAEPGRSVPCSERDSRTDKPLDNGDDSGNTRTLISRLAQADERFIPIVADFKVRLEQRLVEMRSAAQACDWGTLGDIGHWLKGSSASVGLDPLVEPSVALQSAAQLEDAAACNEAIDVISDMAQDIIADPSVHADAAPESSAGDTVIDGAVIPEHEQEPVYSTLPVAVPEFAGGGGVVMERGSEQMHALKLALDVQDTKKMCEILHWLRGSGGNVGYGDYSALCNRMELSVMESLPSLEEDMSAIEAFNERVIAGWAGTPAPDTSNGSSS